MNTELILISVVVGLVTFFGGLGIGFVVKRRIAKREAESAENHARQILVDAEAKARTVQKEAELSAKDFLYKNKLEFEEETKQRKQEVQVLERRLQSREETLDRKFDQVEKKESDIRRSEQDIVMRKKGVEETEQKYQLMVGEVRSTLEKLASTTSEEAKKILMEELISEVRHEAAKKAKLIEDETREIADRKAKKIISTAIERMAGEWVQETSVSLVKLPQEDMKGRIIGREGRNIKALEAVTGVDLIIDDTPGAIVLSCHNPVRREIARQTLERLLQDGRIHPARIEEIMDKVTKEIDKSVREAGQQALFELDIHGVHPELIRLLGSLKYRYSYAQNVLRHSMEVGMLCGIMAAELGMDQKVAKRAGLLHDIGKAVSHEVEGSHAVIGGEIAKKYGEQAPIVHGIWAHHEDIPQESILDNLVEAADALSGARPGARMESAASYVKRLEDLENIATSFSQVEKAFAIQAGRELRVMVEPQRISDADASLLCKDIVKKIESELSYPGQIKITVIRETRAVDFAK